MVPLLQFRGLPPAWRIACIGVFISLPATVVLNWLPSSRATVGGGAMIVGSLIAEGLAATRSVDSGAVGLRAGFLGGSIGLAVFLFRIDTLAVWPLFRVLFWLFAGGMIMCIASAFGFLSGRIGGWVADTISTQPQAGADTT